MKSRFGSPGKRVIIAPLLIIAVLGIIFAYASAVKATAMWSVSSNPTFTYTPPDPNKALDGTEGKHCSKVPLSIYSTLANYGQTTVTIDRDECAVQTAFGELGQSGALKMGFNKLSYVIDTGHWAAPVLVPNTDKLVVAGVGNYAWLKIYENPDTMPIGSGYNDYQKMYKLDNLTVGKALKDANDNDVYTRAIDSSPNGKWLIAYTNNNKVLRINLDTYEVLTFASIQINSPSEYDIAISNDGQRAAVSGGSLYYGTDYVKIFDLDSCASPNPQDELQVVSGCGEKDHTQFLKNQVAAAGAQYNGAYFLSFNYDGTSLKIGAQQEYTLTAAGHSNDRLEYLAMGDSYSSGEGDTEINPETGQKYYRAITDVDGDYSANPVVLREKCHQSTRAYPYRLAKMLGISSGDFKSVACSGAMINDIKNYKVGLKNYLGQPDINYGLLNGRLSHIFLDELEVANAKAAALLDFIPGRENQIEFAEKYQPEIITIGIGGNDAQFERVVKDCVQHDLLTCDWADTDNGRKQVGLFIQEAGNKLVKLFKDLKDAAPDSKIYAIGYPQFVNDEATICPANVLLTSAEREMLKEAVAYFNNHIKYAAKKASIEYIDIENALAGYRLCDEFTPKVTGIALAGASERSESFHPNAAGHKTISSVILNPDPSSPKTIASDGLALPNNQTTKPGVPTYFNPTGATYNFWPYYHVNTELSTIVKSDSLSFDISAKGISPNSQVEVVMASTPTSLGTFTVDSEGKIEQEVSLPSTFEPGSHTLHIYGTSAAGDSIDLYQPIEVHESQNDKDGDSILDNQDPCLFAAALNEDVDMDGTDDGCDLVVEGPPQLYRVRNGTTSTTEDVIYIERNVNLAEDVNIVGDYDDNSDGWAVVAQSQTAATKGIKANFWTDSQGVPHVSFRSPDNGCVQVAPSSLAVVQQSQISGLTVEAYNTSTCRPENPSHDADGNGIPDSTQPLYRVRNGESSISEDPQKIYIERNIFSAEAQLGISDNDTNYDGWALIGVSSEPSQYGVSNSLIDNSGVPTALFMDANDQCQALIPASLSVVKHGEARDVSLVALPSGSSCIN
ncbi:SGNH/GDSL hydrolase family protein [Candidatus Saccharibacteria bacterium]|nr:SGNH/GDSL hydrolase family protein [Candidatus Saccharibacteria bacterium]